MGLEMEFEHKLWLSSVIKSILELFIKKKYIRTSSNYNISMMLVQDLGLTILGTLPSFIKGWTNIILKTKF